jgi:hypothetical protein
MKKRRATLNDSRTLTERRHAKAVDRLHQAENDLARALLKWSRARETCKRYDRRADKKLGSMDWTQLAKLAQAEETDPPPN